MLRLLVRPSKLAVERWSSASLRIAWRPFSKIKEFQSYDGEIIATHVNLATEEDEQPATLGNLLRGVSKAAAIERNKKSLTVNNLLQGTLLQAAASSKWNPTLSEQVLKLFTPEAEVIVQSSLQRPAQAFAEDPEEYFRQYLPYIVENVQSEIVRQVEHIATKGSPPFVAQVVPGETRDIGNGRVSLTCTMRRDRFPRLDHFFNGEILAVRLPGAEQLLNEEGVNFVLGYSSLMDPASMQKRDLFKKPASEVQAFTVELRKEDYDRLRELHLPLTQQDDADESKWQMDLHWHWLTGLTPAERMYDACAKPNLPGFLPSLINRTPAIWPTAESIPAETLNNVALNDVQRGVIARLTSAGAEGVFSLVGPPGTGKTHTLVHLLAERVKQFPEQKILLTAPSNKAVQVVLSQLLKKVSDPPLMALVGVLGYVPPHLEEVYANKYAEMLKLQLLKAVNGDDAVAMKTVKLRRAYEEVLRRVARLIEAPHGVSGLHGRQALHLKAYEDMAKMLRTKVQLALADISLPTQRTDAELRQHVTDLCGFLDIAARKLEFLLLFKSRIVFSTLVSSGRQSLKKQLGDIHCVMVDEAGQALVPETLIPLRYDPKLLVLIGDPQQLRGHVAHGLVRKGYAESLMGVLTEGRQRPHLERLSTQYRMHPSICKWISDRFYDGELSADASLRHRQPPVLPLTMALGALPSAFVDVPGSEQKGVYGSTFNEREAEVIVQTVKYLLQQGVDAKRIGIITFYSAQAWLLREKLTVLELQLSKKAPKGRHSSGRVTAMGMVVSTVDGFQGDERDFILISCVRTVPSVGFLSDHRRINVALSRAKHARWVFGHSEALRQSNSVLNDYFKWVDDAAENSTDPPTAIVSADELLTSLGLPRLDLLKGRVRESQTGVKTAAVPTPPTVTAAHDRNNSSLGTSRSEGTVPENQHVKMPKVLSAPAAVATVQTRAAAVPGVQLLDAYIPVTAASATTRTVVRKGGVSYKSRHGAGVKRRGARNKIGRDDGAPIVKPSDFEVPELATLPAQWW